MSDLFFKVRFCLFCIVFSTVVVSAQTTIDVIDAGIKNDGITNNTTLFQKLIDENEGKNTTYNFPDGQYVMGPILLKSNVEIHLNKNATILASTNRMDYGNGDAEALFTSKNTSNVIISGEGIIDGRGTALVDDLLKRLKDGQLKDPTWLTFNPWFQKRPTEGNRPKILFFENVKNMIIKDITIKDGSSWIQDFRRCDGLLVDNIKVLSNCYWNNDGIDVVDSKNVVIKNSFFDVADDGICLKSERADGKCFNVLVQNCKVRSSASAVKLGTASWGGFENIRIKDITIYDTYRSAIAIESVDGGILKNVLIENIIATNTGNGIFVKLGNRNKTNAISTLENVVLRNIKAIIPSAKPDKGYPMEGPLLKFSPLVLNSPKAQELLEHPDVDTSLFQYAHNVFPASISGLPNNPVKNIILENIELIYDGGGSKDIAYFPLDSVKYIIEGEKYYPEFSMFGELPVAGLYVRHAENISLKNVKIRFKGADFRVATLFDDVNGLKLEKLKVEGIPKERMIRTLDVKNIKMN